MAEERTQKVLVCDDDDRIREIIGEIVKGRGYDVQKVNNGKEACEYVKAGNQVDLMIIDIMMPEMDGYEALANIKDAGFDVPTIMLTAKTQDKDIVKGYRAGADYYITKPFSNKILLKMVDHLLNNKSEEELAL